MILMESMLYIRQTVSSWEKSAQPEEFLKSLRGRNCVTDASWRQSCVQIQNLALRITQMRSPVRNMISGFGDLAWVQGSCSYLLFMFVCVYERESARTCMYVLLLWLETCDKKNSQTVSLSSKLFHFLFSVFFFLNWLWELYTGTSSCASSEIRGLQECRHLLELAWGRAERGENYVQ